MRHKVVLSWSGGKDSALACHRLMSDKRYELCGLFTLYNSATGKVNLHGTPIGLIRRQAAALALPLYEIALPASAPNAVYEQMHTDLFRRLAEEQHIHTFGFGDLFVEEIRQYRDRLAAKACVEYIYPLWGEDTKALAGELLSKGFSCVLTAIDSGKLPGALLGRQYDSALISELPEEVDICGENGEFHTFVWNGPGFNQPISYKLGEMHEEDYRPAVDMCMKYVEIGE